MSRYLLLVILNTPFILAAILGAIVNYKLKRIGVGKLVIRVTLWTIVFVGLVLAEPIYNYLFSNGLTQTEPLSLFDVIQITALVFVIYISTRTRSKLDHLERRVQDLHQELSIQLSKLKKK